MSKRAINILTKCNSEREYGIINTTHKDNTCGTALICMDNTYRNYLNTKISYCKCMKKNINKSPLG